MLVQIKMRNHNLEVEVSPSDTVLQIKEKVTLQHGVLPETIQLLFCGRTLRDEKTAEDYRLTEGCVMFVLVSVPTFAAFPIAAETR